MSKEFHGFMYEFVCDLGANLDFVKDTSKSGLLQVLFFSFVYYFKHCILVNTYQPSA